MRYHKTIYQNLDGKPVIRYTLEHEKEFYVEGSIAGAKVHGSVTFHSQEDLEEFAKALSSAWNEHLRVMPKLQANAAGH